MARTGEDEKEYLPKRQRPETECRLIVLLLLSGLPEAADTFLLRCCSDGELLTYFELMPALSSLTREGQVVRRMDGTSWRYRLTQAGQETQGKPMNPQELVTQGQQLTQGLQRTQGQ